MIAIASNLFQEQLLIVLTKALCVRSDATEWLKKVAYLAAKQPRRARNYGSSILRKSALKNWLCNRVPGILDQQFLRQSSLSRAFLNKINVLLQQSVCSVGRESQFLIKIGLFCPKMGPVLSCIHILPGVPRLCC